MEQLKNNLFSLTGLVVLGILFIALVMLNNTVLRGMRLDLTENDLYTVSDGTRNVLKKIDEPITLYLFFSEKASRPVPALRPYATRVQEMLEEFSQHAGGKLRIDVIDPQPFSEEEDQAAQFGLRGLPTAGGDSIYLGLAGTNAVGDEEVIPFFDPAKEAFLEYDLARLVYTLATPEKPVIGLMSSLPMGGDFNPQTRQPTPSWVIDEQIGALFEVRDMSPAVTGIEPEIDVLMVVHPKGLSDETQYAIDQFILRGGKAIIFVDPHAEVDQPTPDPNNPAAAFAARRSSSLEKIFSAWGIEIPEGQVVGDAVNALQVAARPGAPPTSHLALIGLGEASMDDSDVTTAGLSNINLGIPGYIRVADDAVVTVTPLLQSSDEAGLIPADRVRFLADPSSLRDVFNVSGERYTLAARIQGEAPSAFADGAPGDGDTEGHLARSEGNINVVVVADADMLADQFWVQAQNFFGRRIVTPWADNGDFIISLLDNLSGSSDLIGIRSRATYRRPFDRVEALQRKADERFAAKEQELQDRLLLTEDKLTELQSGRDDKNTLIMTNEQRAEIERFLDERVRVRKELRGVRRDLDRDIENLGLWIKVINVGLVPVLIVVLALAWVFSRGRRQRQESSA